LAAKRPQDAPKTHQEDPKTAQDNPKTPPTRPKIAPRRHQNRPRPPKTAQDARKTAQDRPWTAQDGLQTPIRRRKTTQEAPRRFKDAQGCPANVKSTEKRFSKADLSKGGAFKAWVGKELLGRDCREEWSAKPLKPRGLVGLASIRCPPARSSVRPPARPPARPTVRPPARPSVRPPARSRDTVSIQYRYGFPMFLVTNEPPYVKR